MCIRDSGPAGAPGRDGVDGAPGADGRDGQDGHTPSLSWQGTALAVDGVPGPDLRGPAGKDGRAGVDGVAGRDGAPGPAPSIKIGTVTSGTTPSATITGTSPDLTLGLVLPKGDRGDKGETGAPGVVSSASAYVLVGPGRPDTPSTTGGTITGSEPVGAEYRSTDGANVGAFVWRKRPGNVWAVMDGDTGWRELPAGITSGTVLMNRARRIGQSVFLIGRTRNDTGSLITWPKIVNTRPAAGFHMENAGPNTPPMAIYLNDSLVDLSLIHI